MRALSNISVCFNCLLCILLIYLYRHTYVQTDIQTLSFYNINIWSSCVSFKNLHVLFSEDYTSDKDVSDAELGLLHGKTSKHEKGMYYCIKKSSTIKLYY